MKATGECRAGAACTVHGSESGGKDGSQVTSRRHTQQVLLRWLMAGIHIWAASRLGVIADNGAGCGLYTPPPSQGGASCTL